MASSSSRSAIRPIRSGATSSSSAPRRPPLAEGPCTVVFPSAEPGWTVELVDTGLDTMSGGRIKRLAPYLGDAPFMLTWCDGLADVDLDRLRAFHRGHGRPGDADRDPPAGALRPARRWRATGSVAFKEKVDDPNEWINGAFFVLDPGVFDYIDGDATQFEHEPLARPGAPMAS